MACPAHGTRCASPRRVRAAVLVVLAACTIGDGPSRPPIVPAAIKPPEPPGSTYNTRVVGLRTTLGRAGIGLVARGVQETLSSSTCELPEKIRNEVGCARCELAGPDEPIDDGVLEAIKSAFDRYPTSFLVATGVKSVALCKHIEYEVKRDHLTAGTADIYGNRMLLSVEAFEHAAYDPAGEFTAEDIVHHELFHLLEWNRMRDKYVDDREWPEKGGYVNEYAETNAVEDRASVFQYLMARPDELCSLLGTDEIVRTKVDLVWTRVAAIEPDKFLRERAKCVSVRR